MFHSIHSLCAWNHRSSWRICPVKFFWWKSNFNELKVILILSQAKIVNFLKLIIFFLLKKWEECFEKIKKKLKSYLKNIEISSKKFKSFSKLYSKFSKKFLKTFWFFLSFKTFLKKSKFFLKYYNLLVNFLTF